MAKLTLEGLRRIIREELANDKINFNLKTGSKKQFISDIKSAILAAGFKPGKVHVANSAMDAQSGYYGAVSVSYKKPGFRDEDEYGDEYAVVFVDDVEEAMSSSGTGEPIIDGLSVEEPDGNTDSTYATWSELIQAIKTL
jgi:hypothetical protein